MKLESSRPARQGMWRRVLMLALGLLLVGMLLVSCASKKVAAPPPAADETSGGAYVTSSPAQSLPGRVVQHAMGTECKNNLDQIRQMIMIYRSDNNGENPPSLSALQGLPGKMQQCPISHTDYTYDPSTGEVHCTFPGHEQF
jgi:hypothetical protein